MLRIFKRGFLNEKGGERGGKPLSLPQKEGIKAVEKTLIERLQEQLRIKKQVAQEMAAQPWGEAHRHHANGMLSIINDIEKILQESGLASPERQ